MYTNPFAVRDTLSNNGFWYTLWFYTPLEAWAIFVGWQMLRFQRKQDRKVMSRVGHIL